MTTNPLQAWADAFGREQQIGRRETGMTLGGLIAALAALPPTRAVSGLGPLDSYRGYYSDLAFDPSDTPVTVADVLRECRNAMGCEFTGYKGGEYLMGEHTPLWVSEYGRCGPRLVGLNLDADPITPIVRDSE